MNKIRYVFLALLFGLITLSDVEAVPVTFDFSGTITSNSSGLPVFDPDTRFSGYLTYDTEAANLNPGSDHGVYVNNSTMSVSFSNGVDLSTDLSRSFSSRIQVLDYVYDNIVFEYPYPLASGFADIDKLEIWLMDGTGSVFSDVHLLTTLHLTDFDHSGMPIFVTSGGGFLGQFESFAPVPEPSTMFLLASGLGGFFAIRRKFNKMFD